MESQIQELEQELAAARKQVSARGADAKPAQERRSDLEAASQAADAETRQAREALAKERAALTAEQDDFKASSRRMESQIQELEQHDSADLTAPNGEAVVTSLQSEDGRSGAAEASEGADHAESGVTQRSAHAEAAETRARDPSDSDSVGSGSYDAAVSMVENATVASAQFTHTGPTGDSMTCSCICIYNRHQDGLNCNTIWRCRSDGTGAQPGRRARGV